MSERLVFCKNEEPATVEFQTDKTIYEKREKVVTKLKFFSPEDTSLTSVHLERNGVGLHLSVAITDDKDLTIDSLNTIRSSLLLSSELRGYIENPAYYLQENNKSATALDLLMLTHGWRRYNVPEVTKGNLENPKIPFQIDQKISGKAKSPLLSKPVHGSEIVITSNNGDFKITSTDEKGQFIIEDFVFSDSTSFFIQALNKKGNDNVVLDVDNVSFPALIHAPQNPIVEISSTEPEPDAFIVKAEQRSMYDEDMRVYNIDEVVISAPSIRNKKDEPRLQYWANENSDKTIRRDAFEKLEHLNISDIIRIYAGTFERGSTSLLGSDIIAVFLDGVEHKGSINDIGLFDVESIDIFRGASAAMFGVRGATGVISITTRRWEERPLGEKSNQVVYRPLGFQKPAAFYSPKYETQEAKWSVIPDYRTTIFWKPDVVISEKGEASFEFYTSDFKTTYSVVIEGLTDDGRIVRQVEKIQVK
jgi:TonB-dependent SusC/RagA subfamily outer membrane receptor